MLTLFFNAILVVLNVLLAIAILVVAHGQAKDKQTMFGYAVMEFCFIGNTLSLIGGML